MKTGSRKSQQDTKGDNYNIKREIAKPKTQTTHLRLRVDVNLMGTVSPMTYVAATAALSWLPADVFHRNYSTTFGKFESFAHQNV